MKGPLPPEQVVKCGIEICEGLEKAHRGGVDASGSEAGERDADEGRGEGSAIHVQFVDHFIERYHALAFCSPSIL